MMNGYRKSDSLILSEKSPNKIGYSKPMAEEVEKRRLAERNPSKRNKNQAQMLTLCKLLFFTLLVIIAKNSLT